MRENIPWTRHIKAIEKHLEKNEKWFQYPEKRMHEFENEMDKCNKQFLDGIRNVEKIIAELEGKLMIICVQKRV